MSEHDGFHIMPMYYRVSTHAIPIRAGQTDIGVPIQDIIIQAMGDRDAKLASAGAENERLRGLLRSVEWVRLSVVYKTYERECPVCFEYKTDGHDSDCPLAAALAKKP